MSDVTEPGGAPVATPVAEEPVAEASAEDKTVGEETEVTDASTDESDAEAQPETNTEPPVVFSGSSSNLVPGAAILLASTLAFSMGMTDVFFAEAIAWTFVIWGLLLIYGGIIDTTRTFTVKDDALVIANPARPFSITQTWEWANITRLDVVVKRRGARLQDMGLRVYYAQPGELAILREDRNYDPKLAELIIERAGLNPADGRNPQDLHNIPTDIKTTYTWTA